METLPKFGARRHDEARRAIQRPQRLRRRASRQQGSAFRADTILYNVIGFQPPDDENGAVISPVGDDASRMSAIPISEGFSLGYCRAKPGKAR
jgi:hypothetical protein